MMCLSGFSSQNVIQFSFFVWNLLQSWKTFEVNNKAAEVSATCDYVNN